MPTPTNRRVAETARGCHNSRMLRPVRRRAALSLSRGKARLLCRQVSDMRRQHLGSGKFEDFLAEDGMFWKSAGRRRSSSNSPTSFSGQWNKQNLSKAEIAKRLRTSRTGVDRLLDPENTSITLNTMAKVAHLLGKRIGIRTAIGNRSNVLSRRRRLVSDRRLPQAGQPGFARVSTAG